MGLGVPPVYWTPVDGPSCGKEQGVGSKRRIRRELGRLGWEVMREPSDGAISGSYGPYRLSVQFDPDTGSPASLVSHRLGEGVFVERWRGVEGLPTPEEIVRRLSKRRAYRRPHGG